MDTPDHAGSDAILGQHLRDAYIRRYESAITELNKLGHVSAEAFAIVAQNTAQPSPTVKNTLLRLWGIR